MTTQYKQPISVLVVVFYEKDGSYEVLLLEKKDFPGFWQSVTGSRENEEERRDTAIRELKEETGLDLSLGVLRDWHIENIYEIYPEWRHRYAPGITRNHEHVFGFQLMKKAAIKISPEHRAYHWMDWQHAAARVFSPSNRQAILLLPERSHGY
jgi:dATP pyrophosphohydrolase